MICISCEQYYQDGSTDYLSIFIGVATIFITIYVVYLGKKVEIKINKFNKLCLEPLESEFKLLENLFIVNRNNTIQGYLNQINDHNSDLCLILTEIKEIYPKMDVDQLQDISHEFTDMAFQHQNEKLYIIQAVFLRTKIKILSRVYNYALEREINFINSIFRK